MEHISKWIILVLENGWIFYISTMFRVLVFNFMISVVVV